MKNGPIKLPAPALVAASISMRLH